MSRLTVKSHRPVQWSLAIILLSMLIALFTWILLDETHWSLIYSQMGDSREHKRLWELNRSLENENENLRERVLMMERTQSLDKNTAAILQENIKAMQDKIYHLKGEIEFYQEIMADTRDTLGLNIHGIHIESLPRNRSYRLTLVLTHVTKSVKVVEGTIDISFEGMQDGVVSHLNLQDITLDDALGFSFKFRNFKRFESNLQLPEGFVPRRVFVRLQPKGKKQSKIKRVFDWPATAS
ncbi:MAG: DUF6776 family protein [Gammaproteobacteria bacterium]